MVDQCQVITNDLLLYGELGRYPLIIGREVRIIKYWLKLHSTKSNNCILWAVISMQRNEIDFNVNVVNRISTIKIVLGFPDIWMLPSSVDIHVVAFIAILSFFDITYLVKGTEIYI